MRVSISSIVLIIATLFAVDIQAKKPGEPFSDEDLLSRTLVVLNIDHLADLRPALLQLRYEPGLPGVLDTIATSQKHDLVTRSRAVTALLGSPSSMARPVFLAIFDSSSETAFMKRKALEAMALRFKTDAAVLATRSLRSHDLALRETSIKVINAHPTKSSITALRRHLTTERNGYLRKQARRVLTSSTKVLGIRGQGVERR
jgi:hypothetical protein